MQYIGVDIAKHTHVAASELDDGAPHGRPFSFPNTEKGFAGLLQRFDELGATPDDCLIIMESTGHYWMALGSSWMPMASRSPWSTPCSQMPSARRTP